MMIDTGSWEAYTLPGGMLMNRPTQFEQAYIDLYNGRLKNAPEFAEAAGIEDVEKAWDRLVEYRKQVLRGEIPDPRDAYRRCNK